MTTTSLGARLRHLDLYKLLDVVPEATDDEIRRAYRRGALTCHPDKHPDDEQAAQRFVLLTQARDVLLDAKARMTYDALRDRYGLNRERDAAEPRTRRRGTRRVDEGESLSEQRLAERAQRSRSVTELTTLWQIGSIVVRAAILRNVACPVALFGDPHVVEHWMLSLEAANRAQCPPAVLEKLAASFERCVALAVAAHPATPAAGLDTLAARHRDPAVLLAIAMHRNTGAGALRVLGRAVRGPRTAALGGAILAHPLCPADVARHIRARLGDRVA